jgi:oligopeptide transport system substrate-binding protein
VPLIRKTRTGTVLTLAALLSLMPAGCAKRPNVGTQNGGVPLVGFPETPPPPQVPGKSGGVFRLGIVEPVAIDPYNSQESEGNLVTENVFTELINVNPDGSVSPGVATSWTSNADCSQWTFTLKHGTTFHNGEPVDSAAFKRGWERAAARSAASEVAYHLNEIQGFDAMQTGTADHMSGVDATAPDRLVVALAHSDCEFYLRTYKTVFSPVPTVAGPADNKTYNDQPIGNGPFMMEGPWQHDRGIRLKRFDGYAAGPRANLDEVDITILPSQGGVQAEYDGFNNGTFDWARLPTPLLSQARATYQPRGEWISKKTAGINYLLPMVTTPPLNSAAARKAISEAIDRIAIARGVFQGSQVPADAFVPPALPDAYQSGVCTACRYDPDEAKKLAQQAGLTPGTTVNFQFNTGGGHEEWTAAVTQQLKRNLGLNVNYSGVPFTDLLNNEQQPRASGIFRAAWGADYPTPGNFLQPLLSTAAIGATSPSQPATGDNRGRYSNPRFDQLLAQAAATRDKAQRVGLYQQAEQLAIGQDLAEIPLWFRQQFRLANTTKFGNVYLDFAEEPTLAEITLR